MAATSGTDVGDEEETVAKEETVVAVSAHSTSTDRTLFVELDNRDAWISTDHTVDLER